MPEYLRGKIGPALVLFELDQDRTWRTFDDGNHNPLGHTGYLLEGQSLADALNHLAIEPPVRVELGADECYHRMSRALSWPHPAATPYAAAWRQSVRVTQNLGRRLRTIFETVEPIGAHDAVYGHDLRMLLLLACNEVEASCRAVLRAHGATPSNGKKFTMDDYRRLAPLMRLGEWQVQLVTNPDYGPRTPFAAWAADPQSGILPWYKEHHAVKHDREQNFHFATLANAIQAVGAAFVLRVAQFGQSFATTASEDEFEIARFPAWIDSERYVPPVPKRGSRLSGTTLTLKKHPAL